MPQHNEHDSDLEQILKHLKHDVILPLWEPNYINRVISINGFLIFHFLSEIHELGGRSWCGVRCFRQNHANLSRASCLLTMSTTRVCRVLIKTSQYTLPVTCAAMNFAVVDRRFRADRYTISVFHRELLLSCQAAGMIDYIPEDQLVIRTFLTIKISRNCIGRM